MRRIPMKVVFFISIILGVLVMGFGQRILLKETAFLDIDTLCRLGHGSIEQRKLFYYVLQKRMAPVLFLTIGCSTYLGVGLCYASLWLIGFSAGAFLTAGAIRYGIKGILLALVCVFPQYLVYAPAYASLFLWCETICRRIYFERRKRHEGGREDIVMQNRDIVQILLTWIVFLVGCEMESYVNPHILSLFLKTF